MERVKIIQIGKITEGQLVIYESLLDADTITKLFINNDIASFGLDPKEVTGIPFNITIAIGEGHAHREIAWELNFPKLHEVSSTGNLENIWQYYADHFLSAADVINLDSYSELTLPHAKKLHRLWCKSSDLFLVNRPCRSKDDFDYIRLKVEEYILEKSDEYAELERKVERLKALAEREQNFERNYPTDAVLAYVLKRDNEQCVICNSKEKLQFDHILPKSRGGNDEPENLRVLCRTCNLRRGNLQNQ